MGRLFGTDGVRGVANQEPMTPETVMRLGRALAYTVRTPGERRSILIGKDTRLTGYMLETALTAGITSMGVDVLLAGPLPTPGIAFLTRSLRADAGVVISASHNPSEDNGIKFFSGGGLKLPDAREAEIEEMLFSGAIERVRPGANEIGKAFRIEGATGRYIEFVKASFPRGLSLRGLKVVVDCAHGATYKVTPSVLRELGADVLAMNVAPDGLNINDGCGSLHPEALQRAVTAERADVGFAHDGDGDRVLFVDERGGLVDGDQTLAVCAADMQAAGRLPGKTVVATVMSNLGLELFLRERGISLVRTPVGDRYVLEAMLAGGFTLGGEQSGHIIFSEHNSTGDGIVTALQLLAVVCRSGRPLSELAAGMRRLPQVLENVRVRRRADLAELPAVREAIARVEAELHGTGRVLVRFSGTEPLVRVMLEGPNDAVIRGAAGRIAEAVRASLG
ncbi:MAG: phosphoglucosamine mutase, partial [Candidatus Methylomirabilota bacterium]